MQIICTGVQSQRLVAMNQSYGLNLSHFWVIYIINKHAGYSDPLFNRCNHAQEIPARKWLRPGKIISRIEKSTQYNLSKALVLEKIYGILNFINKCQN